MMQSLDGLQAYDFPPFGLLYCVLSKVQQSQELEVTLVALFWSQQLWFPDLLGLQVEILVVFTAEGSTQTPAFPLLPPEPPHAQSDCLSLIQRSARHLAFSSAVAHQLAYCRRPSDRLNYQAKSGVLNLGVYVTYNRQ